MLVRPALGIDLRPRLRFGWGDDMHTNPVVFLVSGLKNRLKQDIAGFHGAIVAAAEQIEGSNSRKRAHFVLNRRIAITEEALDRFKGFRREFCENAEAKGLRCWRVDAVEDDVGSGAFHPAPAAVTLNAPSYRA